MLAPNNASFRLKIVSMTRCILFVDLFSIEQQD